MLDMGVNQGAGLHRIALQAAPRVMAVASHGQQQGELPLLWSLCATLVDLGHSVAVLDATTVESADNPGLAQLLDDAQLQGDENSAPLSWSVIPAAIGLAQLCQPMARPGGPLAPLSELFQRFGVVVIYAQAGLLTDLLPDSGIEPLLTVAPVKMSAVRRWMMYFEEKFSTHILNSKDMVNKNGVYSQTIINAYEDNLSGISQETYFSNAGCDFYIYMKSSDNLNVFIRIADILDNKKILFEQSLGKPDNVWKKYALSIPPDLNIHKAKLIIYFKGKGNSAFR